MKSSTRHMFSAFSQRMIFSLYLFALSLYLGVDTDLMAQTLSVPASEIVMWADTLPESKSDPWSTESQGNQLSYVLRRMIEDPDGSYWWGSQDGLIRYERDSLFYFDIRDIHGQTIVPKDMLLDEAGELWFTQDGGLTHYDGMTFDTYTTDDGLRDNDAWGLCFDTDGDLWIGTMSGACRFDGETFTSVDLPTSIIAPSPQGVHGPDFVRGFLEDCQGRMWLAQDGGVYRENGEIYERISVMEEDGPTYVGGMFEDKMGDIWFSTSTKGLIRFDGERFINASQITGAPQSESGAMFEDSKGELWFSVENQGVYCYDGNTARLFSTADGLESNAVHQVFEDSEGRIWFIGWAGAYRYDPAEENVDGKTVINITRDGPW